jgi:hypothetical protein
MVRPLGQTIDLASEEGPDQQQEREEEGGCCRDGASSVVRDAVSHTSIPPEYVSTDVEAFDPACYQNDPEWTEGNTPYSHLCHCMDVLCGTKKRLLITATLTNGFRALLASSTHVQRDLLHALQLLTLDELIKAGVEGGIANQDDDMPPLSSSKGKSGGDGRESSASTSTAGGVGGASVSSALMEAVGTSKAALRALYRQHGDLGDAALECIGGASSRSDKKKTEFWGAAPAPTTMHRAGTGPPPGLTVTGVVLALRAVADETPGKGVVLRKKNRMVDLLRKCRGSEIRFMTRTMLGLLRIGASSTTIVNALARAAVFEHYRTHPDAARNESAFKDGKSKPKATKKRKRPLNSRAGTTVFPSAAVLKDAEEVLSRAFNACPSWERTVALLLSNDGLDAMSSFRDLSTLLHPGIPVKPMLAKVFYKRHFDLHWWWW